MPKVTGSLRDFGLQSLLSKRPRLVFVPARPGVVSPNGVLVDRVVVKTEDFVGSNYEVTLAQTTNVSGDFYYTVRVEWQGDSPQRFAEIEQPLRVPASGGNLFDLLKLPAPQGSMVVSRSNPGERVERGGYWVDTSGEFARIRERL